MSVPANIFTQVYIGKDAVLVNGVEVCKSAENNNLKDLLKGWYAELGIEYPKFFKMDHLSQLAFLGAEVLFRDADVIKQYASDEIAILLSNSSASLDTDKRYHETICSEEACFPSPAVFVYTLPSIMCGEIAIRHGIQGENNFFVCEQFDFSLLMEQSDLLFSQTNTQVCLVGWVQVDGNDYELIMYLIERSKQ